MNKIFWPILALGVMSLAAMAVIDQGLKVPAAPLGIISFQFCGVQDGCGALLEQWGERGRLLAMLSLGIDYLFLVTYPVLVSLALFGMLPRVAPGLRALTKAVAWIVLGSGLADAIENYLLIQILLGNASLATASTASVWATIKFSVFYASLAYLLIAWLAFRKRNA